jgi:hypothetical protein
LVMIYALLSMIIMQVVAYWYISDIHVHIHVTTHQLLYYF